jgi:hypothetical protein
MKKLFYSVFGTILFIAAFESCASVKPYERIYVNDPEMRMEVDAGSGFRSYVYTIREGATPAGRRKSSGGCGCN